MFSLRNGLKTLSILVLVLAFVSMATSIDSVYDVDGEFKVNEPHNFVFLNQSSITDSVVKIESPSGDQTESSMSNNADHLIATVGSDFFTEKGVYNFHFELDGERAPSEGTHSIYIGAGNQTLHDSFIELAGQRPLEDPFCAGEDDFTCEYEHFQASMMIKATEAYFLTGNSTFREEALNFSTKEYGSQYRRLECRHSINDFDCGQDSTGQFNVSGAKRQGSLIDALWTTYSVTGNGTVRDLARNYARGSAEECNVWAGEFDCNNGENQGYMASGYWKAYEVTGDDDFKNVAQNLTLTNYTHPRISSAASRAYRLTGNESYLDTAKEVFRKELGDCGYNCSRTERLELSIAAIEGYKATNNHGFYVESFLTSPNGDCYSGNGCQLPSEQGLAALASGNAYKGFKDEEKEFYNPVISENPSNNESLVVKARITGLLNNSEAVLYDDNRDELSRCNIDLISNSCEFDHVWQDQQVYYVGFESESLSYPEMAMPVTYTQRNPEIVDDLTQLINSSSGGRCDPNNGDYTCVISDERSQTEYITGFADAYNYIRDKNYSDILTSFSTPPYHYNQEEVYRAECLPDDDPDYENQGSYSCTSFDGVLAGQKQGSLISSLFEAYSLTNNESIKNLAQKYASTSVNDTSDCQVWNNEFECRSSSSQGEMIQGYWTAYRVTGNESHKNIAEQLVNSAFEQPASYELAYSMWEAYTMSGNQTHIELAKNLTSEMLNNESCQALECGTETYIDQGELLHQAYTITGNESYRDLLSEHLDERSEVDCIETGGCEDPRIQGKATSFMTKSAYTMPLDIGIERDITVDKEEITVGQTLEAVCKAENTLEGSSIPGLNLTVSSGLELGNKTFNYQIGALEFNQTNTTTNQFTAESTGTSEIICLYTSPEFDRSSSAEITIVPEESEEDESDSSGGGSSPSPSPGVSYPQEPEVIDYEYAYREYNHTDFNLNESFQYYDIYSDSCMSAQRILKEDETILEINQSCSQNPDLVVQDTFNETDTRTEKINNAKQSNEISYSSSSNREDWSRPDIAILEKRPLSIDLISSRPTEYSEGTYLAEFGLNRPQMCTVRRNGEVISQDNSVRQSHNITLVEGENEIDIDCKEATESFNIGYSNTEDDSSLLSLVLPVLKYGGGGLFFTVVMSSIYYRKRIISSVRIKIFDYYFDRLMQSVEDGDTDAAVNNYKKMTKYCSFPAKDDPELAAREGIKMYMMIDLVSDAGTELNNFNVVSDVKSSLGRYLTQNPDNPLSKHIKEKIKDMEIN